MSLAYGLAIQVTAPSGDPALVVDRFQVKISDGNYQANWPSTNNASEGPVIGYASEGRILFSAAPERAGTYDIVIQYPGYAPVELSAIQVLNNGCHVKGQFIPIILSH